MKRSLMLIFVFVAATAVLCVGCTNGRVTPSPSPAASPMTSPSGAVPNSPAATPDIGIPGVDTPGDNMPGTGNSPNAGTSPDTSGAPSGSPGQGGGITGFEEGTTVDIANLPDVKAAIAEKYADATIKSVTYATYLNEQMYLVTLEGAGEGNDKVYVKTDGTIVPYNNTGATSSGT